MKKKDARESELLHELADLTNKHSKLDTFYKASVSEKSDLERLYSALLVTHSDMENKLTTELREAHDNVRSLTQAKADLEAKLEQELATLKMMREQLDALEGQLSTLQNDHGAMSEEMSALKVRKCVDFIHL